MQHTKTLRNVFIAIGIGVLSGCAHDITISPDLNKIAASSSQAPIGKPVGYYISAQDKALRVITPAGGGDKVEYAPYADFEAGLAKVLSNVFGSAQPVKDAKDQADLQSKNIAWVFTPTLTTNSSSRNSFFWPPTDFTVTLNCTAANSSQQQVWQTNISSSNDVIAVNDTLHDHGLAGKKAMEKALSQLQDQLLSAEQFRK